MSTPAYDLSMRMGIWHRWELDREPRSELRGSVLCRRSGMFLLEHYRECGGAV